MEPEGEERSVTPMASIRRPCWSRERRPLKRQRAPVGVSPGEPDIVEPAPDTPPDSPPDTHWNGTVGIAASAAAASTPPRRPRCDCVDANRSLKKQGEPSTLPWSPDRFYINELPCLRDGDGSRARRRRCCGGGGHGGDAGHGGGGRPREEGQGSNIFFSLRRLVEVVTGDGWPGLKGVILGTYSLDTRKLLEECPALMTTPTLILHGDKRLGRTNRSDRPESGPRTGTSTSARTHGDGGGDAEDNYLVRRGHGDDVSPERRRDMEQSGRRDRLLGWEMSPQAQLHLEKVNAGSRGVHHPKFGMLFLKDGSLVMYVGTGNLGTDTAIDATWVQRFGAKSAIKGHESGRLGEPGGSSGLDGTSEEEGTWEGDFAEFLTKSRLMIRLAVSVTCSDRTLQDFLEQESRLVSRAKETFKVHPNTPVEFMRRVLGVEHVGESFDFRAALVDLIPTVPIDTTPVEFMRRVLGVEHVGESFDFRAALVDLVPTVPIDTGQGGTTWSRDQGHRACNGGSGDCNGDWERGAGHESGVPRHYGQLRLRYVLGRRRRQAGELGPNDVLIVQPTSVGLGVDHAFMEIFAASCMPDSVEPCGQAWKQHIESRLESSRVVWPSGQYMDACRAVMSKSACLSDRQAATSMEVSSHYVLGESDKDAKKVKCGFLFMTPQTLESMGVDLRDCLRTFHLHPTLGLPLRPAHVKSLMRLRPAPQPFEQILSSRPGYGGGADLGVQKGSPGWRGDGHSRVNDVFCGSLLEDREREGGAGAGAQGQWGDAPRLLVGEEQGPCEHARHLAWFLLTSACLSQGAQGVVRHAPKTGVPLGVHCKNVELGVLFHSTPQRAYYVEPVPGCGCGSGRRRSVPDLEARPSVATASTKRSGEEEEERDGPRQRNTPLLYVPLPVPFRLDSEPYSNPEAGSPDLRFLPYMHILKEFPSNPTSRADAFAIRQSAKIRSAGVESLLTSKVTEAQFA